MSSGADKVTLCSSLSHDIQLARQISDIYGSQAVTAWFDCYQSNFRVDSHNTNFLAETLESNMSVLNQSIGDVVIHSIQRDGTGNGFDLDSFQQYSRFFNGHPIIISGGAGKSSHFIHAMSLPEVSGASTANLLNFIGSDMQRVRNDLITSGLSMATWD